MRIRNTPTWPARTLAVAALAAAAVLAIPPAFAEVMVSGPYDGSITGGEWQGTYGECFYLIPWTDTVMIEEPVGPDYFSQAHDQYAENNCYGGPLFSNFADESRVDWRVFKNDADPRAFAYTADDVRPGSAQYNPCIDGYHHATWDNDLRAFDPLSVEVMVDVVGSI